jgi:hypothetical protein
MRLLFVFFIEVCQRMLCARMHTRYTAFGRRSTNYGSTAVGCTFLELEVIGILNLEAETFRLCPLSRNINDVVAIEQQVGNIRDYDKATLKPHLS